MEIVSIPEIKIKPDESLKVTDKVAEAVSNEPKDFLALLVKPHKIVSTDVKPVDMIDVMIAAKDLFNLCYTRAGNYYGAYAMSHSQINDKNPKSFFVTQRAEIIINPVVTRHSSYVVDSEEGCVTFYDRAPITVKRYQKIEVDYNTVNPDGTLSDIIHKKLSGPEAFVWQHEIAHGLGHYIFEETQLPTHCLKEDESTKPTGVSEGV